jgi:hypothetical protein
MTKIAAAVILTAVLTGCTNSVPTASRDQLVKFQPGKTNETEVIGALGKPLETVTEADGTKIDQYPLNAGTASFMPSFLGGSDSISYDMVSLSFAPNGILKSVAGAGAAEQQ